MTEGRAPTPPRPPQWVGEGDLRRDVGAMPDRELARLALDTALRLSIAFRTQVDAFNKHASDEATTSGRVLKELGEQARRLEDLERGHPQRVPPPPRIPLHVQPPIPPHREELQSAHEWDGDFREAAKLLSQRVKDPHDRLDSDRARAIAKEVVASARVAEDAKAFRVWRNRAAKIAFDIAKAAIPLIIGAGGGALGLKAVQDQSKPAAPVVVWPDAGGQR